MIGPSSFSARHYVPVLRIAPGELRALSDGDVHAPALDGYTPLLLVIPKTFYDKKIKGKAGRAPSHVPTAAEVDGYLDSRASDVSQWGLASGRQRRAFVDVRSFEMKHNVASLGPLFAKLTALGYNAAVPVTYVHTTSQHPAVRALQASATAAGVALRLGVADDLAMAPATLRACGVTHAQADLLIDLGTVNTKSQESLAARGFQVLQAADAQGQWRSITVLSGAMRNTKKYDSDVSVPRCDWLLWREVRRDARAAGVRLAAFGDYGTLPPPYKLPDVPNTAMPVVRYSCDDKWIVRRSLAKGKNTRMLAYQRICDHLSTLPEYRSCSAAFSDGDLLIDGVARRTASKYGTAQRWVSATTSHHMFYVAQQLLTVP